MPIKLYYYPVTPLGASLKLLLAYGDDEFKDEKSIPMYQWPTMKLSFGCVVKMPIKLYYYPVTPLGASLKLLLAYGDDEFKDEKSIPMYQWPTMKLSKPFGMKYAECICKARYLGRKYGLEGDSDEDIEIDWFIELFTDIVFKSQTVYMELKGDQKAKQKEELLKNYYPYALEKLDTIIKYNNGHVAYGKLTWGDFILAGLFDYLKFLMEMPDLDKKYLNFKQVYDAVYGIPKIKAISHTIAKTPI